MIGKKQRETGGRARISFCVGLALLTLLGSTVRSEAPPPVPGTGNPLSPGASPTDHADFEDDDFIDPGGFPKGGVGAPPPPPPPPPSNEDSNAGRTRIEPPAQRPRTSTAPARMSTPPTGAGTTSSKPAQKLADYLELDASVKGLEVKNFDLPDKDIKDVVTLISKWTGKNFILDSKVRGKITIIGPSQVSLQEAYQAFLSALEANGLTTVQSGKFIRIIESAEARRAPVKTYAGEYAPKDDQFITRVIQLKYINADEVQREFRDLTTRQGKLFAYEPTNSLIITDTGSNIQRIKELLETLDVKSFETTLHLMKIRYNSAKLIADMLGEIYGDDKKGGGSQARTFRRSALERTRGGGIVTKIIPDEQTNSLVVLANQAGLESLKKLVAKLDVKVTDTGRIHVYYCEYAKAEDLAQTLAALAGGGGGGGGGKPSGRAKVTGPGGAGAPGGGGGAGPVTAELEGGVKITSDAPTNSLVITANASDYQTMKRVIRKLDIPRLQVFVETAILEIQIDNGNEWGTNVGLIGSDGKFRGGFTTSSGTQIQNIIAGLPIGGATVPIFGPSFSSAVPGGGVQQVTLTGLVNFIATNTNTSVLSTPQIIALDNEKAEFKVQDEIPVLEGFQAPAQGGTNPANFLPGTIGKKKVGIDIKITPHINAASRVIRLEIEQTFDSLSTKRPPEQLGNSTVATTTRETKTQVVVKDKDFVALGGYMTDKVDETITKVPLLGDIPILGWLFKGRSFKVSKTNLIILLQPKIIGTTLSAANIIKDQMEERDRFIDENMSGDRFEEKIGRLKERLKGQETRIGNDNAYEYKNEEEAPEPEEEAPKIPETSELEERTSRPKGRGKKAVGTETPAENVAPNPPAEDLQVPGDDPANEPNPPALPATNETEETSS